MARSFGRILSTIWTDEDFCARSAGAQRLYMMLLSQRSLSLAGALDVMPKRWARHAPDTSAGDIANAIDELDAYRFIVVDHETDELVIRTMAAHDLDIGRLSGKVAKGFWSAWAGIESGYLREVVIENLPDDVWAKLEGEAPSPALDIRRSCPIDRAPPPPNGTGEQPPSDSDAPSPIGTNGASPTDSPSPVSLSGHRSPVTGRVSATPVRNPDAERLCHLLADSIGQRGSTRPTVSKRWIDDMDKLLRIDGRTVDEVAKVIRWLSEATDDVSGFWQANIRSPLKLRQKWDQMREQYKRRNGTSRRADRAWDTTQRILEAVPDLGDGNPLDQLMRGAG